MSDLGERIAADIRGWETFLLAPFESRIRRGVHTTAIVLWWGSLGIPETPEWRAVVADMLRDEQSRRM